MREPETFAELAEQVIISDFQPATVVSKVVTTTIDEKAFRKARPIYSGFLAYFPDAIAEVAHVSFLGNEQHNPGEPLHWARHKSTDQMDAGSRHITDRAKGQKFDTDGGRHLAKAIWRFCAELQLELEEERKCESE